MNLAEHPLVAAANQRRDEARAAYEPFERAWHTLAGQLSIARNYGVANGRSAHELEPLEREAREAMEGAFQAVIAANDNIQAAQRRAVAEEYYADQAGRTSQTSRAGHDTPARRPPARSKRG